MKYFTANGLWFPADNPKNRVAGTHRHSEHGLRLRLMIGFRGGWTPEFESYPVIHGVVGKNPYGEFITLIDCFTTRRKLSSAGIGLEVIHCNWGIAGDSHLSPDYDEFDALNVRFSYLDDWFGRKGTAVKFVPGEGFGLDVSYRQPEPVRLPIDQATLTLGMAAGSNQDTHRITISEEAHVFVKPLPRLTAERLLSAYVRPLQDLLSFATDTPNAAEEIELQGAKVLRGKVERNRKYHLLHEPIFRPKQKRDRLASDDMLFTFDEAQEADLNIFERWFRLSERHKAFHTVYFAWLYAPPRYLSERFAALLSAFTLLTTSTGEVLQRTAAFLEEVHNLAASRFTEEERVRLDPILPTGSEIELPSRLLGLLERHRPLMGQVVGDDLPRFVKSVSETLAFLRRRTIADDCTPLRGEQLLEAMGKIRILIKIVLLEEIGFDEGRIAKFIKRTNSRYT